MGQRLLLVDSDRRFIQDHQVALESSFDVEYLYAAEGVIEALESGRYGAVMICVEIADNKGYAICSAIRRLPALAEIKIALISAKATEEEYSRHKTLRGHADLYLHKPIASASLVAELGQLVPLRTVDPDNPLGDLTGTDLGEEWLDSLRAEVEAEAKAETLKAPEPSVPPASSARIAPTAPPAASRPMPAIALPSVILPVDVPKEAGRLELMESRIKDLEQKLRLQEELLEARERELAELPVVQDRATRNLEEALQCRLELGEIAQKLKDTEEALMAQETRAAQAENGMALLQSKVEEAERAADEWRQQVEGHAAHLTRLDESESLVATQKSQIQELEARLETARLEQEARERENENLRTDLTGLEATLRGQRRELAEQAGRLGSLTKECEALLHRAETHEARSAELESSLSERASHLEAVHRELAELHDLHGRLQQDLTQRDEHLASAQAAWALEIETRETRLAELKAHLDEHQQRIETVDLQRRELEGALNERTARLESISEVVADLESSLRRAASLTRPV